MAERGVQRRRHREEVGTNKPAFVCSSSSVLLCQGLAHHVSAINMPVTTMGHRFSHFSLMFAWWFVIWKSILLRRKLQMTVKHNKSWTLTTQTTTASEIDGVMVKGMFCSLFKAPRNINSFKGRVGISSIFLIHWRTWVLLENLLLASCRNLT